MFYSSLLAACLLAPPAGERPRVVIAVGAPGGPEYQAQFNDWAGRWQAAAKKAGADVARIGQDAETKSDTDRDRLKRSLTGDASTNGEAPLWLVLIGHGTFDGREAKFNLRGPDVTDVQLAEWLSAVKRPVVVVDCTSSSGTFLNRLSGPNRAVVTATRSGSEQNFARFGQHIAEAIDDPRADIDKDGQVSLLEAFLTASRRTAEWYKTRSQLATEHALIDDNGDRLGTPADWFLGFRATKRSKDGAPADGPRAHQLHLVLSDRERQIPVDVRRKRDALELQVAALRDQKGKLAEDEFYRKLESLMVELARVYRDVP